MDSVRFGRALGIGARSAAKALSGAADAAAAPNPTREKAQRAAPTPAGTRNAASTATRPATSGAVTSPVAAPVGGAARTAAQATFHARQTSRNLARGGKRFGEAVWGPFAKLSGVLWLEITGSFFGIFALFAGQAVWAHRADLRLVSVNHDARVRAIVFLTMAIVFGYFCISSFLRARRRGRRG